MGNLGWAAGLPTFPATQGDPTCWDWGPNSEAKLAMLRDTRPIGRVVDLCDTSGGGALIAASSFPNLDAFVTCVGQSQARILEGLSLPARPTTLILMGGAAHRA